jgi:hypothetical protein
MLPLLLAMLPLLLALYSVATIATIMFLLRGNLLRVWPSCDHRQENQV